MPWACLVQRPSGAVNESSFEIIVIVMMYDHDHGELLMTRNARTAHGLPYLPLYVLMFASFF